MYKLFDKESGEQIQANSKMRVLISLICLALISVQVAETEVSWVPRTVFGRPFGGFMNNHLMLRNARVLSDDDLQYVETKNITQKVDNFNSSDKRTYEQRYMVNMRYYKNGSLVFVLVGGESAISKNWIADPGYRWLFNAKKHGAAAFQVEHRFFGESRPLNDTSTTSYQYFTIEQALADLRNFILEMNKKYFPQIAKPRWVLFGGSYPGALSAWFRSKNPDITIASISSSGVIQARVDYYDYAENVEYVLRKNGSEECAENVKKGMEMAINLTYSIEGRKNLTDVFRYCPTIPDSPMPRDIQFYLSNIFYTFEGVVQYTGDNRDLPRKEGLGVPKVCKIMNNASFGNEMKRLQEVINFVNSFYTSTDDCGQKTYTDFINQMANTTYNDLSDSKGWVWLCCTQIGFQQTTDNGESIFGSILPLDFYTDQCMQIFGSEYDTDFTRIGVKKVNDLYGGYNNYQATRVILANGSYDPWKSVCGYQNDTEAEVYAIMIEGGAHCSDMYPANETFDSESLKNARQFIDEKLDLFIQQSLVEPTIPTHGTLPSEIIAAEATPKGEKASKEINILLILCVLFVTSTIFH